MVVLPGGQLAMGRYEVTVGEYRAFAAATGGGAGAGCDYIEGHSWRDPGFRQNRSQTDRHPVVCVNWNDAHEYLAWLSTRTGATYRLPSDAEWDRAAAGGQQAGCYIVYTGGTYMGLDGTCPVGSYGLNAGGLSDMVGNVSEWTTDCYAGDCGRRASRGGSWGNGNARFLQPSARTGPDAAVRCNALGFRVVASQR